jgi:hypothetical protein
MVGRMLNVIGEDIGLVDVVVPAHNKVLSVEIAPQRIIPSANLFMGDSMIVDNCYTGCQSLTCHGLRTGKKRHTGAGPMGDTFYVVLEQGIFATNTPYIPRPPQIRTGMCGTPIIRVESLLDTDAEPGDVCGFFLWTDIKGYHGSMLYAYCQPTDPLIDDGWTLVVDE